MFTYSLSTIKNSKNARTFDAFLCKVHKYACEKPKIHKSMQLCANICKRKGKKSRIKEASAEAIGSSYGQQTGQQAYNAYLQQLNEIVPELYAQAREQWQSGEAALYDRYQLLSSREQSDYARYRDQMSDYYAELDDARSAYASAAKLANDNYWSSLEYQADREDAANAQYWKQLAYADKQAAAAEAAAKAAQNAAAKSTGTAAGSRKQKTASSKAGGRSTGVKKTRSSAWTSGQAELN